LADASGLAAARAGRRPAHAGIITSNDTVASDLVNALTSGGAGGITVTGFSLSTNTAGATAGSGIYATSGSNHYNLPGSGIVITSGNASQDGTSGQVINSVTTAYGTNATASQTALLNQVAPAPNGWHDVTELDITFTAGPTTSKVFFNTVFASAEYPVFVILLADPHRQPAALEGKERCGCSAPAACPDRSAVSPAARQEWSSASST
jgi:hypothetical protein